MTGEEAELDPSTWDAEPYDGDECWQCGGEGYISNCFEEYACVDPESGCDLCTRRCDICNRKAQP